MKDWIKPALMEAISPEQRARIEEIETEYARLADRIDRAYERERPDYALTLEPRAEELRDILEGIHADLDDAGETMASEMEASLEEQLANTYLGRDRFFSQEDWISNMRSAIETEGLWQGITVKPTEDQILEAARDAANRRLNLIARYKKAKGTPKRVIGSRRLA